MKLTSRKWNLVPDLGNADTRSQRGRPRKRHQDSRGVVRSYWFGEVFITDHWTWGTELVEVEPGEGEIRRCEALPLCLGREDDIVPVLKGEAQMPDDMDRRRRTLLEAAGISTGS